MFTGIIEKLGKIRSVTRSGGAALLVVEADGFWDDVKIGDSIAIDGVCLTVIEKDKKSGKFDVSKETLDRAVTGGYRSGTKVNLEKALRPTDRMGGHFVQGHVDGIGKFTGKKTIGDNAELTFEVPAGLERYIVEKGSISISGISLTAASVEKNRVTIAVIPHTLKITSLSELSIGDSVNIECDVIAKYTEKLLSSDSDKGLNIRYLSENGFT
jgi:riboflavin synthase